MKKLLLPILASITITALAGCPSSGGDDSSDDDDDGSGLGCRNFVISSGADGDSSTYLSSVFPGQDLSEFIGATGWADETVTLCAGVVGSDGKAALSLDEDAIEAISLPANNCLCRQLVASGSTGTLYCSASTDFLDFTSTQDSAGAGAATPEMMVEGPGTVTAEGHARITFSAKTTGIDASPASCTVPACETALSSVSTSDVFYTTGTATSEFTNTAAGGTKTVSVTGQPFGACADWTSQGEGALAGAPEHDEDNPDAGDVVTVERIAEAP